MDLVSFSRLANGSFCSSSNLPSIKAWKTSFGHFPHEFSSLFYVDCVFSCVRKQFSIQYGQNVSQPNFKLNKLLKNHIYFSFGAMQEPYNQLLLLTTHIQGSVFIIGMILGVFFDEFRNWLKINAVRIFYLISC